MTVELRAVSRAAQKAALAHQARDDAIREAAKHHSLAQVAKAAGISRGRVHQIVRGV